MLAELLQNKSRAKILKFFVNNNQEIYHRELVRQTGLNPRLVSRELKLLSELRLLKVKKIGRITLYVWHTRSAAAKKLRNFILATEKYSLPEILRPVLWWEDLQKLDLQKDVQRIITNCLLYGNEPVLSWLFREFSQAQIKTCIRKPLSGEWDKKTLYYWQFIFDLPINLPPKRKIP